MRCFKSIRLSNVYPETTLRRREQVWSSRQLKILRKALDVKCRIEKRTSSICVAVWGHIRSKSSYKILSFEIIPDKNNILRVSTKRRRKLRRIGLSSYFSEIHPVLYDRSPEETSLARTTSFNKSSVDRFFNTFKNVIDTIAYWEQTFLIWMKVIYLSTVQKKCQTVYSTSSTFPRKNKFEASIRSLNFTKLSNYLFF